MSSHTLEQDINVELTVNAKVPLGTLCHFDDGWQFYTKCNDPKLTVLRMRTWQTYEEAMDDIRSSSGYKIV